jgi:hypothetical protein
LRNILYPLVEDKEHELLAKLFSSTRAAPLWLGTLVCGEIVTLLDSLDHCAWYTRSTCDTAAWTGIPRSFLSLQPPGPYLRDGSISRSDVWRLRRDLRDRYESLEHEVYALEPNVPWRPFGIMHLQDVEVELHDHLTCSHRWFYEHWTWRHDLATDAGFRTRGSMVHQAPLPAPVPSAKLVAQCVSEYQNPVDVKYIRDVSKRSTAWTFKWCGNQVEKGFTGHVVPACHYGEARLSHRSRPLARAALARVADWFRDLPEDSDFEQLDQASDGDRW